MRRPPLTVRSPSDVSHDVRLSWRVGIAMYLLGAVTLFAVLPAPDPDPTDHGALVAIGVLYLVFAGGLALAGPRPALARLSSPVGIVTVSVLVGVGEPVGATPFFYIWPVLHAAYFLTRRQLAASLALFVVTYGVALAAFAEPGIRMVLFVGGTMAMLLVGILVAGLKERLDAVVGELHRLADSDPLTGLLNRRSFERTFDAEVARAHRFGTALAFVVFDLDLFKKINDRHGHARGDEVIALFGDALRRERRATDTVARIGGEEFAVLLPGSDMEGGREYAERVSRAFARASEREGLDLSASAGVATLDDERPTRADVFRAADAALYTAKAAGRGRVAVASDVAAVAA